MALTIPIFLIPYFVFRIRIWQFCIVFKNKKKKTNCIDLKNNLTFPSIQFCPFQNSIKQKEKRKTAFFSSFTNNNLSYATNNGSTIDHSKKLKCNQIDVYTIPFPLLFLHLFLRLLLLYSLFVHIFQATTTPNAYKQEDRGSGRGRKGKKNSNRFPKWISGKMLRLETVSC